MNLFVLKAIDRAIDLVLSMTALDQNMRIFSNHMVDWNEIFNLNIVVCILRQLHTKERGYIIDINVKTCSVEWSKSHVKISYFISFTIYKKDFSFF